MVAAAAAISRGGTRGRGGSGCLVGGRSAAAGAYGRARRAPLLLLPHTRPLLPLLLLPLPLLLWGVTAADARVARAMRLRPDIRRGDAAMAAGMVRERERRERGGWKWRWKW